MLILKKVLFIKNSIKFLNPIKRMATEAKKPKIDQQNPNKELAGMLLGFYSLISISIHFSNHLNQKQNLKELGEFEKNVNKQNFKYNAYRRAAQSLMDHEEKITDINEAKKLVNSKFI